MDTILALDTSQLITFSEQFKEAGTAVTPIRRIRTLRHPAFRNQPKVPLPVSGALNQGSPIRRMPVFTAVLCGLFS